MKYLYVIILVLFALNLSAQNYDLIVKTNGDSIACRIDSVTESKLFFEMKFNNTWIHTDIPTADVLKYQYNVVDKQKVIFRKGSSYIERMYDPSLDINFSVYDDRYLFAPSAFGMKEGSRSFNSYGLLLNDYRVGYSDRFSMIWGGVDIFALYVMPMYTFPINDKSSFAVGDMFMIVPYPGLVFIGNLFYGLYTYGTPQNNFSVGAGLWYSWSEDMIEPTISPAFTVSASLRISDNIGFLTENYYVAFNVEQGAGYQVYVSEDDFYYTSHEDFAQRVEAFGGISGLRFISRRNPKNSFQIGAIYILLRYGDVPDQYEQPMYSLSFEEGDLQFIAFPFLSFTHKIKMK